MKNLNELSRVEAEKVSKIRSREDELERFRGLYKINGDITKVVSIRRALPERKGANGWEFFNIIEFGNGMKIRGGGTGLRRLEDLERFKELTKEELVEEAVKYPDSILENVPSANVVGSELDLNELSRKKLIEIIVLSRKLTKEEVELLESTGLLEINKDEKGSEIVVDRRTGEKYSRLSVLGLLDTLNDFRVILGDVRSRKNKKEVESLLREIS